MKRTLFIILLAAVMCRPLQSGLLVNEVVCGAPEDWAELFLQGGAEEEMEISPLFVTMYYGTNERLADSAVTLFGSDRPGTPWDDRFAVVHPAAPGMKDETDAAGDLNGNCIRDLYCDNYYASYWNSDCVVAIDGDDDPGNGGILDFLAYSNRDGSPNGTIMTYVQEAVACGQWHGCGGDLQLCCVDIGTDGLEPHMAIVRKGAGDTDGPEDFTVSTVQTPGRPNIAMMYDGGRRLIVPLKSRILVTPLGILGGEIPLFVYQNCALRFSLYTAAGREVYRSPFPEAASPGLFSLRWHPLAARCRLLAGLYIGRIEAVSSSLNLAEEKTIYVIMER
ncbi:MAG: hypothetical protein JXA20_04845 [Spirochaetes bacterium]|nr:hypothetical protein [Spirochaetota bacterium]